MGPDESSMKEKLLSNIDLMLGKLGEQCDSSGLRKALLTIEIAQMLGEMKQLLMGESENGYS